jgi:hypothetical protein
MSRRAYWITGGVLVVIAAVAITTAILARPQPLTGDVEADAACNALAAVVINEDGQASGAKLATMTDDERRAVVREVMEHAERSSIPEIRAAGVAFGTQAAVGESPLFGETITFTMAWTQFGSVCTEHGWSPQAAGLITGPTTPAEPVVTRTTTPAPRTTPPPPPTTRPSPYTAAEQAFLAAYPTLDPQAALQGGYAICASLQSGVATQSEMIDLVQRMSGISRQEATRVVDAASRYLC